MWIHVEFLPNIQYRDSVVTYVVTCRVVTCGYMCGYVSSMSEKKAEG